MAAIYLPKGLIVDLITPFSKNGDIDGKGLERHLKRLMPHVQGIFLGGPYMGEGASLMQEQREELFHKTISVVQSRLPILMWISMPTNEETERTLLLLKKRKEKLRYTGPVYWADTPLYYHSNRGIETHYKRLSSLVEEPFILINDPAFIRKKAQPLKRINIRTSILKGLASMQGIEGLIFFGSLDRSYNYRKAVRSHPDFMIYDGDELRFLEHPSLNGVLSIGANLAPNAWKTVTASSLNLDGNLEAYPDRTRQILEAGRYLNSLRNIYHKHDAVFFKQVLVETGIIEYSASLDDYGDIVDDVDRIIGLMEGHRKHSL